MRNWACADATCAACERCAAIASSTEDRWPAGVLSSDCARASWMLALASRELASATAASCCATAASNGGRSRRYSRSPSLHLGAFGEQPLLEEGGDAGGERDAVHRLDAADEFGCFGDRLSRRAHHADRGRSARRLGLRGGAPRKGREQRGEAAQSHRPSFSGLMRRGTAADQ